MKEILTRIGTDSKHLTCDFVSDIVRQVDEDEQHLLSRSEFGFSAATESTLPVRAIFIRL